MTAILNPPEEATHKVILDNISWITYQRLLSERAENPQPRYSYDRGKLEIMVTSYEHENLKHNITTLVEVIAEELGIDLVGAGSTTFVREDMAQGFEPDASFYFQQASEIRGKRRIDLTVDPAPELIIEVDISNPSLNKFPIFAGLGIGEVWRYHNHEVAIFVLAGGSYIRQDSLSLPGVTSASLTALINQAQQLRRTDWLRAVREWAGSLRPSFN